ncbi:MAG TPA: YHS domain-containing (seleno)protein [Steroidobacteraceae bacterium]|nr:YHS domain-containing (seleno)protein [Steroidobacteraceae bacterium]
MIDITQRLTTGFILLCLGAGAALAGDFFEADGFALRGYDPVAYFESALPVHGVETQSFEYKGSKFLFASAANRARFVAEPEKYAPQYGGYCAMGTANGYKVATQPDAFQVVDGKLYLNYNRQVRDIWRKDVPGNITRADANWPEVAKQPMQQ